MSDTLGALGNGPVPAVPNVTIANDRYTVTWPQGRPDRFQITTDLFEAMVQDINEGKKAVAALSAVANALTATLGTPASTT